ncbi:MAG TPA: YqhA family protein [Acetobacteraceae bacterium]|nr:YqhA family protein [Acetobacteraceae bacterium]
MDDRLTPRLDDALVERLERNFGRVLFATRWLMAPIYLGLLAAVVLLAIKFIQQLVSAVRGFLQVSATEAILDILQLVDIALVANLVLIVLFAGWESVIGPLLTGGRVHFSGLGFGAIKLRLIGSIAAIAAILMLETFIHIDQVPPGQAMWQLAILLGIGITGVLLGLMDKLSEGH